MSTSVILYRAHAINETVSREIARLKEELPGHDVFAVGYASHAADRSVADGVYIYSRADLESLGYEAKYRTVNWNNSIGHNDLPVLRFYRDHPSYRHYWIVEYDVRYTGRWKALFDELSPSAADLLGTNVMDYDQAPKWHWWGAEVLPEALVALEGRLKAFLPFARVSSAGLQAIDNMYRSGWAGHYEMAFPTICKVSGLSVEDIGGNGRYTPASRRDKHYLSNTESFSLFPGTFVFKPSFGDRDLQEFGEMITGKPMLWHPIK